MKLSFQPLFLSIVVKYNSFLKYFFQEASGKLVADTTHRTD